MSGDQSFGVWLKEQRKLCDLTQDTLAEQAGCSADMVRKIESGRARPSRQLAELLITCLGVPPAEHPSLLLWARTGQPLDRQPPWPTASTSSPSLAYSRTLRKPSAEATAQAPDDNTPSGVENPYKGLLAFQEKDAPHFFGRESLTGRLVTRMSDSGGFSRFLAVVGPSGSGKSSVVRAGLLPALREHKLPGGLQPLVVDLVPGAHPLKELEAALLKVASNRPPSLMELLWEGERGLARAVKRVLPSGGRTGLLLIIDQFEELFTLTSSEAERKTLLGGLFEAVSDSDSYLWVVVTLRADFYDHPLLYLTASELVGQRTEVVGPLNETELYRAITGPAGRAELTLEQDLPATIIADVIEQPGALPLMEYALTELYERREGRLLTLRAYMESGGVQGSLARRAESLYAGLSTVEQAEARQLFLRLVTLAEETGIEDTRRRARRAEIASAARDEEALGNVLDLFGRYRMLTFDRDHLTGGPTVEVAHEALLRRWPRLHEWLDTGREQLLVHRRLMSSTVEWKTSGQEPSFLASGTRLARFAELQTEEQEAGENSLALTVEEQAYLRASLDEQQRREAAEQERLSRELLLQKRAANRLRYLVAGLAVFLVLAAGLASWAVNRSQVAQANEQAARTNLGHADALRLAAEANNLMQTGGPSELAGLLSLRSIQTAYTPEGDAALEAAARLEYPVRRFAGLSGAVRLSLFSPDGKTLLSESDESTLIWDVATGKELARVDFGGGTLSFSPDGQHILAAHDDGTIHIWNTGTMTETLSLKAHATGPVVAMYSPDGNYILSSSAGTDDMTARVWEVGMGKQVQVFQAGVPYSSGLAWSPDGKFAVTGGSDNIVRVWDVRTGVQVRSFDNGAGNSPTHGVNDIAYSPDGKTIAASAGEGNVEIWIWDAASGARLSRLVGHSGINTRLSFSPDGKLLLTSGSDKTARLWDAGTGQTLKVFRGSSSGTSSGAFSPDGRHVATGYGDGTVLLWDALRQPDLPILAGTGSLWSVAFSADDRTVLTGSDADKMARLWDVASGRKLSPEFPGPHDSSVNSAAFSPDGKYVLTANGSNDKGAHIWDIRTGAEVQSLYGHAKLLIQATYSPDGTRILTASGDNTARLWDAASARPLITFTGHTSWVNAAAYAPDGSTVLTGSADHTARLWDTRTGKELRRFAADTDTVEDVAYSPDGKRVVTGSLDGTARLWDLQTGALLGTFSAHASAVSAVAVSPDGNTLLTGSADDVAHLWDIGGAPSSPNWGRELRSFSGHHGVIQAVAFSHNGKLVLTGSADGTARVWHTYYQDTVRYLCGLLTRDLTDQEREQYSLTNKEPVCPAHQVSR